MNISSQGPLINAIQFTEVKLDQSDQSPVLMEAENQIREYFNKEREIFNLPLAPTGTDFQKQVWKALIQIPYGKTMSYGELASQLGDSNMMRAVGTANGKNPIPIVIPCHRVIGSDGKMVGYAGGVNRKIKLLELEGALIPFG